MRVCERCGEPNRVSVLWCRLCGHVLGHAADPLPSLHELSEPDRARVARDVEEQLPSRALLILATLTLGWTGVPRMLLGQVEGGFVLTMVGGVLALGAVALRVGEHGAAPLLVVALAVIWVANALTLPGTYARATEHVQRAALLKVTLER